MHRDNRLWTVGLLSILLAYIMAAGCGDDTVNSDVPILDVTPDLIFREVPYQVGAAAQWVHIRNGGDGDLAYTVRVAGGSSWLTITGPISTLAPDSFLVSFGISRLQAGSYVDTVWIESPSAANSPVPIKVKLVMENILEPTPDSMIFTTTSGGPEPAQQNLIVETASVTPADFTLSNNRVWLSLDRTSGTTPDTVGVRARTTGLSPGIYHDTITISSPSATSDVLVPCSLVVASWHTTRLDQPRSLRSVQFLDASTGWIGGASADFIGGGLIFRSVNGGADWTLATPTSAAIADIVFVDNTNGWAVGSGSTVLRTANGGTDWIGQTVPPDLPDTIFNAACFIDTLRGWIVGNKGILLRTDNGGNTWTHHPTGTANALSDVCFVSPDSGWIVGNAGIVLFSSDSGKTWQERASIGFSDLSAIVMADQATGWAAGESGTIARTGDGGGSWTLAIPQTEADLNGLYMRPDGRGWAVGSHGVILYTPDGASWGHQPSGVGVSLRDIDFIDDNTGWIVGDSGTILKTTSGGL